MDLSIDTNVSSCLQTDTEIKTDVYAHVSYTVFPSSVRWASLESVMPGGSNEHPVYKP